MTPASFVNASRISSLAVTVVFQRPCPEDVATIVYSQTDDAEPVGCVLTHANVMATVNSMCVSTRAFLALKMKAENRDDLPGSTVALLDAG